VMGSTRLFLGVWSSLEACGVQGWMKPLHGCHVELVLHASESTMKEKEERWLDVGEVLPV
jgi:hypothetical protein